MSEKDKIYFEGIRLNEGAYFYMHPIEENIKEDIKKCFSIVKDKTCEF